MGGTMMTTVGLPFEVFALTHSPFAVGAVGLAQAVPLVVIALYSGALADSVDRRRMVITAEIGGGLVAAGLVVNTALPHPALWAMYVGGATGAACYALLRPPMDAIVPRTVEPDELTTAFAFEGVQANLAFAAGPALAGLLLAATSVPVLFAVDLASFAASAALLARLPSYAPAHPKRVRPLSDIREGLAYARSRPELIGTYVVDLVAMIFGLPSALFVALAPGLGGPRALGLLFAAPAVGAVLASASSGWARNVRRQGRAIVLAAAGWGLAIVAFGLVDGLVAALCLLALAGAMDAISGLFRFTLWNATIPDHLRGRLAGLEMVSWGAGPGLGDLEAGAVAGLTTVRAAIVSGGLVCLAGCAATAVALPALWRYEAGQRGGDPGEVPAVPAGPSP